MAIKEYIKKTIETESGFVAECWSATGIWIDIKANCAVITLEGYKDFASKEAGKTPIGKKDVTINDLTQVLSYAGVHTEVVDIILNSEIFSGATHEQVEV